MGRPGYGGLARQLWALPVLGLVLVGWWLLQAVVSVLMGQLPGGLLGLFCDLCSVSNYLYGPLSYTY